MSLMVNAYVRKADGEMEFLDPDDPSHELAGFEAYRQSLYGGHAARSLGLRLLPSLAAGDLYAEGENVERLRAEAELALENLDLFAPESEADAERLRPRFDNIVAAARRAAAAGGGVVIW